MKVSWNVIDKTSKQKICSSNNCVKKYLCADCPNFCYSIKVEKNFNIWCEECRIYFLGIDALVNIPYTKEEKCDDTLMLWTVLYVKEIVNQFFTNSYMG